MHLLLAVRHVAHRMLSWAQYLCVAMLYSSLAAKVCIKRDAVSAHQLTPLCKCLAMLLQVWYDFESDGVHLH